MSIPPAATDAPPDRALAEFEAVYRANVAGVTGFSPAGAASPRR